MIKEQSFPQALPGVQEGFRSETVQFAPGDGRPLTTQEICSETAKNAQTQRNSFKRVRAMSELAHLARTAS